MLHLTILINKKDHIKYILEMFGKDYDAMLKQHQKLLQQAQVIQQIKCDPKLNLIFTQLQSMSRRIIELQARKPQIIRIKPIDLTGQISLHASQKFIQKDIIIPNNYNVFGLLLNIYYYNTASSSANHGYLSAKINQKYDQTSIIEFRSTKFNWYANSVNELEVVPWKMNLSNVLQIKLYDTYNTEGSNNPYGKNYYIIKLVGYMTF